MGHVPASFETVRRKKNESFFIYKGVNDELSVKFPKNQNRRDYFVFCDFGFLRIKRNKPLVTKNEAATSSAPAASAAGSANGSAVGTENLLKVNDAAKVEATTDSPLQESFYVDAESAPNLTAGGEDFSSIEIKFSYVDENGNPNETQFIRLEHRLAGVGPRQATIMSARHTFAGTTSGTNVFTNKYLPLGKFDVENNFFGIEVKNETEFNALKYSLIYKEELNSRAALITTRTINEYKFHPSDENATKLSIPQTKVRFLKLNARKIRNFSFAKAKEKSECAFGNQYPSSVLVNLFDLGDVSDFYLPAENFLNADFSKNGALFSSELLKIPSLKIQELPCLEEKSNDSFSPECPRELPNVDEQKVPLVVKFVPYEKPTEPSEATETKETEQKEKNKWFPQIKNKNNR